MGWKGLSILVGCFALLVAFWWWKYAFGVPFSNFGPSDDVAAVQTLEQTYWREKRLRDPVYVVVSGNYSVGALMGDAGISLTLYQRKNGKWIRSDSAIGPDACSFESAGVPKLRAALLSAHLFRAVPTIPYHDRCAG